MGERLWPIVMRTEGGDLLLVVDWANVAALEVPVRMQQEQVDAAVILLDSMSRDAAGVERLIDRLVSWPTDWVEVLGEGAEAVHDAIDAASVRIGRQSHVGGGSPMTAWHDDIRSISEIVEYVISGGHGACDMKVVVLVGAADQVEAMLVALHGRMR